MEVAATDPQAGETFLAALTASGVTLSSGARTRLAAYCEAQNTHSHGQLGITVGNLDAAYSRLKSLGVFADGEIEEPTPEPVTPKDGPISVSEILATTDTSTREGNAKLKAAVDYEWMQSYAPLVRDWYAQLEQDYGIVCNAEDAKYLFDPMTGWFAKMGLGITPANLNAARRHMARSHRWVDAQGHPAISVEEYFLAMLSSRELEYSACTREFQKYSRVNLWTRPLREAKSKGLL